MGRGGERDVLYVTLRDKYLIRTVCDMNGFSGSGRESDMLGDVTGR